MTLSRHRWEENCRMKIFSTDEKTNNIKDKLIYPLISLVFWLGLWWIFARCVNTELLLPGPYETFSSLWTLISGSFFWKTCFMSFLRILAGTLSGILCAIICALLCSFSSLISHILTPLSKIIKTTPVASFIILAMLWLGHGVLPSVIAALMVFPPVFQNMLTGIGEIPYAHKKLIRIFRPDLKTRITKIYVPDIMPYFFASVKVSTGLAWKAGIAAEVLAFSPDSIGRQLTEAKNMLETPDLFAWTCAVIIISLAMETLIGFLFSKIRLPKKSERDKHHDTVAA